MKGSTNMADVVTSSSVDTKAVSSEKSNKPKKPPLTSYEQIEGRCEKKKKAYERCFSLWWKTSFIAGKLENSRSDCDDLFEIYQNCYLRGVKQVQQHHRKHDGKSG
jgi:hypothetical protein